MINKRRKRTIRHYNKYLKFYCYTSISNTYFNFYFKTTSNELITNINIGIRFPISNDYYRESKK